MYTESIKQSAQYTHTMYESSADYQDFSFIKLKILNHNSMLALLYVKMKTLKVEFNFALSRWHGMAWHGICSQCE